MGETLLVGRGQAVRDEDLAAAPFPRSPATGIAGLFKRPAARWARVALLAVNLAAVTAFLLSYSRHGVGFGPYRIDLGVYRAGGRTWLHGADLYGQLPVIQGLPLPFTYPPIAAVLLAPLAMLPMAAAGTLLTVGSIALAAVVLRMFLRRLAGPASASLWAVGWLLPPALLLEPVRSTLAYGQVNIVLMALVALDCLAVSPRWPRGALTGLAAAVKLTPAAFVLFFLLRRDYRAAAVAGVSFAATTAAGFALAGPDSVRFWTVSVFQTDRIGNPATAANQCLQAVLARAGLDLHTMLGMAVWLALSALVVMVACRGMRHAFAAGQDCLALSLNAFAALLISPMTWSHHWVWCRAGPAHPRRPRPPPAPPAGGGARRLRPCPVHHGSPVVAEQIRRPGAELGGLAAGHRELLRALRRPRPAPVRLRPAHPPTPADRAVLSSWKWLLAHDRKADLRPYSES